MANAILSPSEVAAIGRAFTQILLTFPEDQLPNVGLLGTRLLGELRSRGLNIAPTVVRSNAAHLVVAP